MSGGREDYKSGGELVIKEIKGSQYRVELDNAVRDFLAKGTELEKIVGFLKSKYFKANSVVVCETEGKEEKKMKVENANVVGMMQKWYLPGSWGVSVSTIVSLAYSLSTVLTILS